MSRAIRFRDHEGFHQAAFHMAAAGGLAGLVGHVASLVAPRLGGPLGPVPLAVVAGAVLAGAVPRETRAKSSDLPIVVLGTAAVAFAASAVARGVFDALWGTAVFAVAVGLLFARGLSGRRLVLTAAVGASAALLARFVLGSVAAAEPGPAWLAAGLGGAAFGTVAVLGTLARHVVLAARPRGEPDEILARARALVDAGDLPGLDPAARDAMRAEVSRLDDLAARWRDLDGQLASAPRAEELTARVADLDRRLEAVTDPLARDQFGKARGEIQLQTGELESIRTARERILARMIHTLAALERRRLGAAGAEADVASQALLEAEEADDAVRSPAGPDEPAA